MDWGGGCGELVASVVLASPGRTRTPPQSLYTDRVSRAETVDN